MGTGYGVVVALWSVGVVWGVDAIRNMNATLLDSMNGGAAFKIKPSKTGISGFPAVHRVKTRRRLLEICQALFSD